MKTLMIDMDNVITDGNILTIMEKHIKRDIKDGDTFYLQNLIEDKESFWEEIKDLNIYEDAPLMKDAYEVLEKLNKQYDIYIVTSYIWDEQHDISANNLKNKYNYLREKLPFINPEKYVFTTNKLLMKFDVAIDDRLKNLQSSTTKILFDAWHNKESIEDDIKRVSSWKEIENILIEKE